MLRFDRPSEPPGFAARTRDARAEIAGRIAAGRDPSASDFKRRWADYKPLFRDAQHGKCAYCEHDTEVSYHGDVEHYAPKAAVDEICADAAAGAARSRSRARTRPYPVDRVSERGYWWLAYAWDNYLYACARCNQTHKRCIFPVAPGQDPRQPAPDREERFLLLNPYEPDLEPGAHLHFSEEGAISARAGDVRGWETIRTCRLDRVELTEARRDKARQAHGLARKLQHAVLADDEAVIVETLAELRVLGAADRPFAGMVRIIVEHEVGESWSDVMAW